MHSMSRHGETQQRRAPHPLPPQQVLCLPLHLPLEPQPLRLELRREKVLVLPRHRLHAALQDHILLAPVRPLRLHPRPALHLHPGLAGLSPTRLALLFRLSPRLGVRAPHLVPARPQRPHELPGCPTSRRHLNDEGLSRSPRRLGLHEAVHPPISDVVPYSLSVQLQSVRVAMGLPVRAGVAPGVAPAPHGAAYEAHPEAVGRPARGAPGGAGRLQAEAADGARGVAPLEQALVVERVVADGHDHARDVLVQPLQAHRTRGQLRLGRRPHRRALR